jgi:hypothetical protein
MIKTILPLLMLAFAATPALAETALKPVTVIELFTSQGCPNCPPADMILHDVTKDENREIITLGCHVTYFDTARYKDALSQTACDARQVSYRHARVIERTYTPQMVINGRYETQGNRVNLVQAAIKMSQAQMEIVPVQLTLNADTIDIVMPKVRLDKPAGIWLYGYTKQHTVDTIAGQPIENPLIYVNAVKSLTPLMKWNGSPVTMAFPITDKEIFGYAVIAQYEDGTHILAAGKAEKP